MKKLIFLLLIVCSPALGALTDNQELWLKFEDDLEDSDDGNHDGANSNTGTDYAFVDGKVGRCIDFNSGDYVSIADFSGLDGYTTCTFACWVKRDDLTTQGFPIIKSSSYDIKIDLANLGEYTCTIYDADGTTNTSTTTGDAAENTDWHHLCVTHNGTTIKLYLDGTEVDSDNPSNWSGSIGNNANAMLPGIQMNAKVDEVRIWSRVLSESEIDEISLTAEEATATPTPTNTVPTPTPTDTWTDTPTITNTPTDTGTNTYTPTVTNTETATLTNTATPTVTFTPTITETFTPTITETPTDTYTATATFTETATPTATFTVTFTPTITDTPTVTNTRTVTPTKTITRTPTITPTPHGNGNSRLHKRMRG